jgi:hypothetical protein
MKRVGMNGMMPSKILIYEREGWGNVHFIPSSTRSRASEN